MVKRAFQRVGTYFYILPSYTQAKKVIWDNIDNDGFKMLDHVPKELIKATNATELKIELINGSVIQLIAGDEFKSSGVGTNPIGVVFSEFSITDPEAWKYLAPILAANGGWVIFNFTPRGQNHAYTLLQQAKNNPKWFWQIITVDDTSVFSKDSLEEEKKSNSQAFFEQEYYCKFVESASSFFRRIRENTINEEKDHTNHILQLGVDLAKYQDWTVITPFCLNCFHALPQDRFNQIDWNLQKARIEAASYKHNNAQLKVDSTGVGDPIAEDLSRAGLAVEAVKFTEQSKRQMLDNLAVLLEQDKIKIPNDPGLYDELSSMMFGLSDTGRVRVEVPSGVTDDRIMSLALAVKDISQPIKLYEPEGEGIYSSLSYS